MSVNVNAFKAEATDAKMINKAVTEAARIGESVVIPMHNERTGRDIWNIEETISLADNSVIFLRNAHLRLADGAVCNMFANSSARNSDDNVIRQRNIHMIGSGAALLDGGIHNKLYENNGIARKVMKKSSHHVTENCMLFFRNVENLVIENIAVKDQRYWAFYLSNVSCGRISNINFSTAGNVPNQDGVDLGKGCNNIIIENIRGCVGDDMIALCATGNGIYGTSPENKRDGDICNVTIRNIMGYGVGGCALIRILNHDGFKIYNIRIDNVIETSPWSETDAALAQNPDLIIKTDNEGNLLPVRTIIPGEVGYRLEAAIRIGEPYWYKDSQACHGDTFGISVSNVMTHARFAVSINNTLLDSTFENIRIFGNGYMAAYMGEGTVENVHFSGVRYDKSAKPHKNDEHICVEWNETKTDGLAAVFFKNTKVENVSFENVELNGSGLGSVFAGKVEGKISCSSVKHEGIPLFAAEMSEREENE